MGVSETVDRACALVVYEASPAGRRALDLARATGAELVVASVATVERVDVGCGRCRQAAAIWNQEMRALAGEELTEAASLVEAVSYEVVRGEPEQAIAGAAARWGAHTIVLPCGPGRLARRRAAKLAAALRRAGDWEVTIAVG